MIPFTVQANRTAAIPFSSPPFGAVRIHVRADGPINVYAVDQAGRERFARGEDPQSMAQSSGDRQHALMFAMSPSPWFLLIENQGSQAVRGVYAVETAMAGPGGASGIAATRGGWGGGWGGASGGGMF